MILCFFVNCSLNDAQIIYFLENEDFYPPAAYGEWIIPYTDPPNFQTSQKIQNIRETLKLLIPVGHNLEYYIINHGAIDGFQVTLTAPFSMFPDGATKLFGYLSTDGKITIFTGG